FLSGLLFRFNRQSLSRGTKLHYSQINPINNRNLLWQNEDFVLPSNISECTSKNCFNISRCFKAFKFFVYPLYDEQHHLKKYFKTDKWQLSIVYEKILAILKKSQYYTSDADEACFFILSFDTLDRDPLSENFVPNLDKAIANLPENLWNNGINHLIFNLYAGTWPDYNTWDFGANFGHAMMAKASSASSDFRPSFDISLPLFSTNLPETLNDLYSKETYLQQCKISSLALEGTSEPRYLLTFKGKRYVHGIGSESRNAIYHLHNGHDVMILTTCKHGKDWEKMKDERCDIDNANYEKFDYDELMKNSTFCLIPRGRRLGSYRFLEALKFGCIPVILANGFIPPFSEV
uniref:Exostosin GT47 domain-containing protein n=1 Tax=Romanomermis culicivorax TaxID=13658 RepID=A0A915HH03_ROMCU